MLKCWLLYWNFPFDPRGYAKLHFQNIQLSFLSWREELTLSPKLMTDSPMQALMLYVYIMIYRIVWSYLILYFTIFINSLLYNCVPRPYLHQRFRRPSKKGSKVTIDNRFKKMFTKQFSGTNGMCLLVEFITNVVNNIMFILTQHLE